MFDLSDPGPWFAELPQVIKRLVRKFIVER
jgi:hypothetical protein